MTSRPPRFSKVFQAMCLESLRQLVSETLGVGSACLVTGDGFEIAAILAEGVSASRLAAMSSSMLALGTAVSTELRFKGCRSIVVEGETGTVVMVRLPATPEMMLSVTCDKRGTVGGVLYAARHLALDISERASATT
jgi:predicted regulator of Ras-like GTPase activity (Roadblock/LC7/MglB family)